MKNPIKKKSSSNQSKLEFKSIDVKERLWNQEIEGSGQRKRYLRSLKDEIKL